MEYGSQSKRINWDRIKVFKKPEYRLPWKLTKYMQGKRPKDYSEPELWLQAAIESGLVEMGSLPEDGRVREILTPINGAPPPYLAAGELEVMLMKGMEDTLKEAEEFISRLEAQNPQKDREKS